MLKNNLKGISLLEAFLASFIFVISVSAILVSLVSLRKPAVKNQQEKEAALVGKQILEELRSKVDQSDYLTGSLSDSNPHNLVITMPNGITYTVEYNVYCLDVSDTVVSCSSASILTRKVDMTISWPDAM